MRGRSFCRYLYAWLRDSDAIAMRHRIQPLTILLAIFGLGQLFLLRRVIERELSEKVPVHCVG